MNDRFKTRIWAHGKMLYFSNPFREFLDYGGEWFNDESFIQMNCTGLRDKNGTLIYEGDIVKCIAKILPPQVRLVEYCDVGMQFKPNTGFSFGKHNADLGLFEIVGNKFENPELLPSDE